ncbi:MAG: hypothetical protein ACLUD1_13035 [Clostridia bacterium]
MLFKAYSCSQLQFSTPKWNGFVSFLARPFVSIDNQPELLYIKVNYIDKDGNLEVAKDQGKVTGSIGLMVCGNGLAIL